MFRKVAESILRNTVLIRTVQSLGTGFLADKRGYVITCNHVVEKTIKGTAGLFRENLPYQRKEFTVLWRSKPKDLAILKLDTVPSYVKEYPKLKVDMESDNFGLGLPVATCGFPKPQLLKKSYVTSGIISSITWPERGQQFEFEINISVLSGNSGGAIFTDEGYIVGMAKKALQINNQILPYTTALHISEIFATLRTVGLNFGWTPVTFPLDGRV